MNILKTLNGITLIALVISIISLSILAGISISILNQSFIERAELASSEMNEATIKEKIQLICGQEQINEYSNSEQTNLKTEIESIEGVTDVRIEENGEESTYIEFNYKEDKLAFNLSSNKIEETELLLKGNVLLGDYIDYPVSYIDAYSQENISSENGWRVIDDGVMEGTTGHVRIISTKIPVKFNYNVSSYENVDEVIEDLLNNFETTNFFSRVGNSPKRVQGSIFKDLEGKIADKVTTVTLEDINKASSINGLFEVTVLGYHYWIASKAQENDVDMYSMTEEGPQLDSVEQGGLKLGIRPIIILKDNLKGEKENGIWKIK